MSSAVELLDLRESHQRLHVPGPVEVQHATSILLQVSHVLSIYISAELKSWCVLPVYVPVPQC